MGKTAEILKIGVPIMLGQACVVILAFADNIMIGWYGVNDLAAASFVNGLMNLFIFTELGFANGMTPLIGSFFGTGDTAGIGRTLKNSIAVNSVIALAGLAIMAVIYVFLDRFGQEPGLLPLIRPYYIVVAISTLFAMGFNTLKQFTDGICRPVVAMSLLMGGNVLNIIGNWVLISRGFGVEDTKQFRVRCYAKDWPKQAEDGTWVGTWQFYEPTLFEEDPSQTPNANATDVYLPVRMKVTISNKDGDIQQVPAPALDDGDRSYWIRMNMGIVHTSGTETHVQNPNGSKGGLSVGWAMCAAPYFAFDTSSLYTDTRQGQSSYPDGMLVWMNDFVCRSMGEKWTDDLIKKMDEDGESAANDMMTFGGQAAPRFNILQQDYLFSAEYNEMPFTSWTMHRGKTCPDMAHTLVSGDQDTQLGEQDQAGSSFFSLNELMDREMPNGAFLSLGELGGVSCGPYETLSLFQTFRWTQDMVNGDFHRVFDYFTLTKQRAPDAKNIELNSTTYDPTANAVQFPAIHNGRVNLNAPQLVYYEDTVPPRATVDGAPCNPYPIASVFNGAAYRHSGGTASNTVTEAEALNLAINLISAFDTEATRIESKRFKTSRRVVSRLSDIGMAADYDGNGEERSPILDAMLNDFSRKPVSDAERESLLNSVINGFTTRGQSYLILLRADAYTPNYGYEDSTSDGTTLATTRAIVEVFRDPEPARMTDGSLVEDKDGPVAYHNWLIRSYRVF